MFSLSNDFNVISQVRRTQTRALLPSTPLHWVLSTGSCSKMIRTSSTWSPMAVPSPNPMDRVRHEAKLTKMKLFHANSSRNSETRNPKLNWIGWNSIAGWNQLELQLKLNLEWQWHRIILLYKMSVSLNSSHLKNYWVMTYLTYIHKAPMICHVMSFIVFSRLISLH